MISLMPRGPRREHHDAVGEKHRFVDLVGDEQRGRPCAREYFQQLHLHEFAGLGVERRERLVEEKELRLHHQGACDVDPLAHPA